MAVKRVYELTQDGVDKLRDELNDLIDNKRPQNLEMLKEARAQGDLSENADYDAARNEQGRIEARIIEIENILKNAKVIKLSDKDIVEIGKTVKIKYLETKLETEFQLVGTLEANPVQKRISVESPIGKALMGHEKGDKLVVKIAGNKFFNIEILEITNEVA
ncbi:transcription elongation factor GreA [Haploplasma axanthum]|uniref:Transcription elongation factor GreA n=1 Tax=Haploplasma axanthum TaxID=29552 RepID=A0A449BE11_HAPAX|nr:transcription elongation factor GreA [Haploplasma axanthum]VEU80668.1 transcription elongation factor GreA [Haploplasma axanthum]